MTNKGQDIDNDNNDDYNGNDDNLYLPFHILIFN